MDAVCGDGVVDEGEECDDGDLNSDTEPDACRTDCTMPICGDNVKDSGEECDDGPNGSDTCTADCKLIVPAVCGDGVVEGLEECDDGENNSDAEPNACREDCTFPVCGDGATDDDEKYGEECDDGELNSDTEPNACRADCTLPVCGDGVVDTNHGEECDDGPDGSEDCTADCKLIVPAVCGDGVVEGLEECDDGENNSDTEPNACREDCTFPVCGDGVLDDEEPFGEVCDDGDDNSDTEPNACRTTCMPAHCGDGVVDDGEECDDGADGSATCTPTCELRVDTDFRWTALEIMEPDVYIKLLTPECDESDLPFLNGALADMIDQPEPDPEEPDADQPYALSIAQQLPLPVADGFDLDGTLTVPECIWSQDDAEKVCEEPADMPTSAWTFTRASGDGTCFTRVPEEANADGWLDNPELTLDETRLPSNADGKCVVGESEEPFSLVLNLLGLAEVDLAMNGARMAYELDEETNEIRKGMFVGFMTHQSAVEQDILGLLTVAEIFNSGSEDSCFNTVPLDKGPDANGDIVDGWWMYLAFEGDDQVTYVVP